MHNFGTPKHTCNSWPWQCDGDYHVNRAGPTAYFDGPDMHPELEMMKRREMIERKKPHDFQAALDFAKQWPASNKLWPIKQAAIAALEMAIFAHSEDLLERISKIEHDQWVYWSKNIAGEVSPERRECWIKLWVFYSELSDEQKEHERIWARKIIKLITGKDK